MFEAQIQHGHIGFIGDLGSASRQRVLDARSCDLLSKHGKLVEIVEGSAGIRFVRRIYSSETLNHVGTVGVSFTEAWQARNNMFTAAGIDIVPHVVFLPTDRRDRRIVVACEYVPNGDIKTVSQEEKTQLAKGLAEILTGSERFLPSIEAFADDMFRTRKNEVGVNRLTLVDIDPYLIEKCFIMDSRDNKDEWFALYLDKITRFLGHRLTEPEERYQVMGAFILTAVPVLQENGSFDLPRTSDAFMKAHATAQGIDFSVF